MVLNISTISHKRQEQVVRLLTENTGTYFITLALGEDGFSVEYLRLDTTTEQYNTALGVRRNQIPPGAPILWKTSTLATLLLKWRLPGKQLLLEWVVKKGLFFLNNSKFPEHVYPIWLVHWTPHYC